MHAGERGWKTLALDKASTKCGSGYQCTPKRNGLMNTTLLTSGIACVAAAIVGGGLKAFGMEIPALASTRRQLMLAGFGACLVVAAAAVRDETSLSQKTPGKEVVTAPGNTNAAPGAAAKKDEPSSAATPNGDSSQVPALRVLRVAPKDAGPGLSMIDIVVQNRTSVEALVSKVDLIIESARPVYPDQGVAPYMLPVSYQYNALVHPDSRSVSVDATQAIKGQSLDRFQVVYALGDEEKDEGPWGSARIRTSATRLDTRSRLRLTYDDGRVVVSEAFNFSILAPRYGFKAFRVAGLSLEAKIAMLDDRDVSVVESVVENLATLGDTRALAALQKLKTRDLTQLQEYYEREIYSKYDARYWALPNPKERIDMFRRRLDAGIGRLTGKGA